MLISTPGNTQSHFTAAEKLKPQLNSLEQVTHFCPVSLICVLISKPLPRLLVAILSPARAQEKELCDSFQGKKDPAAQTEEK